MDEQGKNIDELFRNRLGEYTEQPPDAVWQSLEHRLDNSRPRRAFPWYWGVLSVLCIVLLSYIAGSKLWHTPKQDVRTATITLPKQPTKIDAQSYSSPDVVSTKSEQRVSEINTEKLPISTTETESTNISLPATPISTSAISIKQLKPLKHNSTLPTEKNTPVARNTIQIQAPTISIPIDDEFVIAKQNIVGLNAVAYDKIQPVKAIDQDALSVAQTPPMPAIVMPQDELLIKLRKTKVIAVKPLPIRRLEASTTPTTYFNNTTAPIPPLPALQQKEETFFAQHEEVATNTPQPAYPSILQIFAETEQLVSQPALTAKIPIVANTLDTAPAEIVTQPTLPADTGNKRIVSSWDYGLKTGYETGLRNYAANKGIIGAFIQANFNNKLSLVVQPTLKLGWQKHTDHVGHTSYYDVSKNSTTALHIITPDGIDGGGNPIYNIIRRYFYEQVYDSVVVTRSIQPHSYVELELPLMAQYRVHKGLHLYVGASANFGRLLQAERKLTRYKNLIRRDTAVFAQVNESSPAPPMPPIESRIKHGYSSFDEYNENEPINAANNPVRFHYIFGANYLLKNGLSFDVMIQGMLNDAMYIPDERIREMYKKPYVRIGLGYRINTKK